MYHSANSSFSLQFAHVFGTRSDWQLVSPRIATEQDRATVAKKDIRKSFRLGRELA